MKVDNSKQSFDPNEAPESFYDILFSSSHLKVTFWKYKNVVKKKVPNGFDLEKMDEQDLGDIIHSRIVRKRIIIEASNLIMNVRAERTAGAGRRYPGMSGTSGARSGYSSTLTYHR